MDVSRRDFLRVSAATSGTALGGLLALGANLAPTVASAQQLRIRNAQPTPSVCPCCSVGCATLVHTVDGQIVNIGGDPRSPHNEGTLCPKGAATYQLHVNPNRPTKVTVSIGIVAPLALHWRHTAGPRAAPTAAVLVLVGGFRLRVVLVLSSEGAGLV